MGLFDKPRAALADRAQNDAAHAGRSTATMGSKLLGEDIDMREIGEIAKRDLQEVSHIDEPDRAGKPRGRLDSVLAQLFVERKDAHEHSFRLFDGIESDGDKAFIAKLCHRRWKEGDRSTNAKEVQHVVDICASVGVHWRNAHTFLSKVNGEEHHA